jgi:DNA-binding transcriptional LysR family regulator
MPSPEDLNWDDLRFFLRAMEAKTLAGAARRMRVQHTTIGRRISALERAIGAPLVYRSPEGLRPTPLGEQVAPLVQEVARAVDAVRELVASRKSRVRLAGPSGFTRLFTAARLAELRKEHPNLSLELLSGSRPVDLGKGEADLALRSGPVKDDELVARKVAESGWSLYAAPSYLTRKPRPANLNDLSGHDLIGYDTSLAAVPAARWIEERAAKATIVLRSREMTEMLAATLSGVGIAALPCVLADEEPGLVRLTDEVIGTRSVSLVYRREARLSAEIRAVIRFVVNVMHDNAARMSGKRPTRSIRSAGQR